MWYRDFSQTTDEEVREILAPAEKLKLSDLDDRRVGCLIARVWLEKTDEGSERSASD
jgi:hypothetical protein